MRLFFNTDNNYHTNSFRDVSAFSVSPRLAKHIILDSQTSCIKTEFEAGIIDERFS